MAGLVRLAELAEIAAAARKSLKLDSLGFRVSIPTTGSVTQPSAIKLRAEFDYFMFELRAGYTALGGGTDTTDADAQDVDEVRVNFVESGTGETVFSSDIELSSLMSGQVCQPVPMDFRPWGHKFEAGTDLSCTVTMRANVTTARVLAVQIQCVLAPKGLANYYKGKQ